MRNQTFENSVQQKMNELSLKPSEPVWLEVEAQIRKRKKRRVVLFWLFPLLLAGGPASLWLFNNKERKQPFAADSPEAQSRARLITPSPIDKTDHTSSESSAASSPNLTLTARPSTRKKEVESPAGELNPSGTSKAATINNRETAPVNELENKISLSQNPVSPFFDDTLNTGGKTDITVADKSPKEDLSWQTLFTPADSAATPKETKGKKWQLSIHAQVGISGLKNADITSDQSSANFASGPSSGQNSTYQNPAPVQKSVAYTVGVTAHRQLRERLTITGGLQYSLFSNRNAVGQKVNNDTILLGNGSLSNLDFYYRSGSTNKFHNRYHFLELPIGFSWQVFHSKPLHLQGGISLAQLVSSKALVYDRQARIYYDAGKDLQQGQVHLSLGAHYTLAIKKGIAVSLGPHIQYGLSPLYKENSSPRLVAIGVKTQVVLK